MKATIPVSLRFLLCILTAVFGLLLLLFLLSPSLHDTASVIDGDTIDLAGKRVRLDGIDAPELGQSCFDAGKPWPCGQRAAAALVGETRGRSVQCREKGKDRYGRTT